MLSEHLDHSNPSDRFVDALTVGRLIDALIEMPEPGEEVYSSADDWPEIYDSIRVTTVNPFDPLPDDEISDIPF